MRSGSVLVGTEDVEAARDDFVATVLAMGGRITSESVVTDGSAGAQSNAGGEMAVARDMGMSYGATYPYPWYPTGPGVWLTVQVPVEDYDEAMAAARDAARSCRCSSRATTSGPRSLTSMLGSRRWRHRWSGSRADGRRRGLGDVIALEKAISERQSELDALRAQQRDLADQTAMSQISLTLMSPEDANAVRRPAAPAVLVGLVPRGPRPVLELAGPGAADRLPAADRHGRHLVGPASQSAGRGIGREHRSLGGSRSRRDRGTPTPRAAAPDRVIGSGPNRPSMTRARHRVGGWRALGIARHPPGRAVDAPPEPVGPGRQRLLRSALLVGHLAPGPDPCRGPAQPR